MSTGTQTSRPRKPRAVSLRRRPLTLYAASSRLGKQFVYAIGFEDGRVKIGRTTRPFERFGTHYQAAQGRIAWTHLFAPVEDAHAVEQMAIRKAREVSTRLGGLEWFHGLSKGEALRCVRASVAGVTAENLALDAWLAAEEDEEEA